jgi:hypothetical protein
MDWGIVVSVLVALTLFVAGAGILVLTSVGLLIWRIKRKAHSGDAPFKFPGCPLTKSAQNAQ